jgi:hypothetical protein
MVGATGIEPVTPSLRNRESRDQECRSSLKCRDISGAAHAPEGGVGPRRDPRTGEELEIRKRSVDGEDTPLLVKLTPGSSLKVRHPSLPLKGRERLGL